jgi:hypothetical protein
MSIWSNYHNSYKSSQILTSSARLHLSPPPHSMPSHQTHHPSPCIYSCFSTVMPFTPDHHASKVTSTCHRRDPRLPGQADSNSGSRRCLWGGFTPRWRCLACRGLCHISDCYCSSRIDLIDGLDFFQVTSLKFRRQTMLLTWTRWNWKYRIHYEE